MSSDDPKVWWDAYRSLVALEVECPAGYTPSWRTSLDEAETICRAVFRKPTTLKSPYADSPFGSVDLWPHRFIFLTAMPYGSELAYRLRKDVAALAEGPHDEKLRVLAINTLDGLGWRGRDCLPALQKAAADTNGWVASQAKDAIRNITASKPSPSTDAEEGPLELLDRHLGNLNGNEKEQFLRAIGKQGVLQTVRDLQYPSIVWYAYVGACGPYHTPQGPMTDAEYLKYVEQTCRITERLRGIAGNTSPVIQAKPESRPRPQNSPVPSP
ncbi:MAG: hypothetical protein NTV86_13490 [Planctomycetota bacterium]|nr:hypothetical protein [Planctomycetota bacterium]